MKNKFMKKLTVLCTAATLACSSAPATVPAVTETVQAEAATAKSSAKVLTKSFAKALDKVIKTQKFTAKTTDKQKLQKLFNYTKKLSDIRDTWVEFRQHLAGTVNLHRKCLKQKLEAAIMTLLHLPTLQDVQPDFL